MARGTPPDPRLAAWDVSDRFRRVRFHLMLDDATPLQGFFWVCAPGGESIVSVTTAADGTADVWSPDIEPGALLDTVRGRSAALPFSGPPALTIPGPEALEVTVAPADLEAALAALRSP